MTHPTSPAHKKEKKLLDQYRDALRVKHYSPRTEETYTIWVKNFILHHNKRHPKDMGASDISTDKRAGITRRHPIHESLVQKSIREAAPET